MELEKFYINFSNGKFSFSPSYQGDICWCSLTKRNNSTNTDDYICKFESCNHNYRFFFISNVYLRTKTLSGKLGTSIHVGFKDYFSATEKYTHFDSDKPLCLSDSNSVVNSFVDFLNELYLFDSAEDASLVFSILPVEDYTDQLLLREKIIALSSVLSKYGHSDFFYIKNQVIDWLCLALGRLGFEVRQLSKCDMALLSSFHTLTAFGYLPQKL